jgi:AcrR family transcriptional regulator
MPKVTFERISKDRQSVIFDAAAKEFASHGFHKANINVIAAKAGISIGTMYKYFASKEELFSETLDNGLQILQMRFNEIAQSDHDPFIKLRRCFEVPVKFVEEKPYYLNLYLNLLSGGMDDFAARYAQPIEQVGSEFFKSIIREGMKEGIIDTNLDVDATALFLDNHLMMFTFSQISLYLKIRQDEFMGGCADSDRIIDTTMNLLIKLLKKSVIGNEDNTLENKVVRK